MLVEGMDTADERKIYDIRQTVGMVFQNPDNQIVATVVEEMCIRDSCCTRSNKS